jgi:hypothetical protein
MSQASAPSRVRRRFPDGPESLGWSQGAVSTYISWARAAGVAWPVGEDRDDARLEARLFPDKPVATDVIVLPVHGASRADKVGRLAQRHS